MSNLEAARLNLHFAVQPLAAAGIALAEHESDYSHTAVLYNSELKAFVTVPLTKAENKKAGLRLANLELLMLDENETIVSSQPLFGKTMSEALLWMGEQLRTELIFPEYPDFPEHDLRDSAAFDESEAENIAELAEQYDRAFSTISSQVGSKAGASPVRTWPHHFDMASLVSYEGEKSIGVGFSPGDGTYNQPYWYISPWPYPEAAPTEKPGAGFWHTEGFTAAVLRSSDAVGKDVEDYVRQGFAQSEAIIK